MLSHHFLSRLSYFIYPVLQTRALSTAHSPKALYIESWHPLRKPNPADVELAPTCETACPGLHIILAYSGYYLGEETD